MTALKKEIKHLHTEADRYVQEIVELKKEILKCQASKRVLCERLVYVDAYLEEAGGFDQLRGDIAIELSMPTDDTPLRAALAAERERIAKHFDGRLDLFDDDIGATIRALGDT